MRCALKGAIASSNHPEPGLLGGTMNLLLFKNGNMLCSQSRQGESGLNFERLISLLMVTFLKLESVELGYSVDFALK